MIRRDFLTLLGGAPIRLCHHWQAVEAVVFENLV
jgi:hypothetical protein